VKASLSPADSDTLPATAEAAEPTLMNRLPTVPELASPVEIVNMPDDPEAAVPVNTVSAPESSVADVPVATLRSPDEAIALPVCTASMPLSPTEAYPEYKETNPDCVCVLVPVPTSTNPLLGPLPDFKEIFPVVAPALAPVYNSIGPVIPLIADPVSKTTPPEGASELVAAAECKLNVPEVRYWLDPEDMST
jgi:hypothetical protein